MEMVISGKPDAAGSRLMALHVGMSSIGISIAQLLAHECFISRNQKFPEWVVDYMFSRRIIKKAINQTVIKSLLLMPMN